MFHWKARALALVTFVTSLAAVGCEQPVVVVNLPKS